MINISNVYLEIRRVFFDEENKITIFEFESVLQNCI